MKLNIDYTIENDIWNYLRVYNQPDSYGRTNMRERVVSHRPEVYQEIFHANLQEYELKERLTKALSDEMNENHNRIAEKAKWLYGIWERVGLQAEYYLARLYGRPFPFTNDTLTIHFTTLRSCPYKYEDRMTFCDLNTGSRDQVRIIVHELNHFMFYYYFGELQEELGNDNYELLKESLTFFSNPEQEAYPAVKPLVDIYLSRQWDSIDEAIGAGKNFLKSREV